MKITEKQYRKISCKKCVEFCLSQDNKNLKDCPFCNEKGCFIADDEFARCSNCDYSGDAIAFLMAYKMYGFDEAKERLHFDKEIWNK